MTTLKARLRANLPAKSLKMLLNNNNLALSKTPSNQNDDSSNVKFNADLLKALETDYKTANSHLFTWRHNVSQQDYIRAPSSTKKSASQADLKLEDITDVTGMPELTSLNSPASTKLANMRITADSGFNPFQSVGKRKKALVKTSYDGFQGLEFDEKCMPSVKHQKSYSRTKLQLNLINNQASAVDEVPNYEFMTNQFDRKNYTVNKIISQISAQNDRLDKEEIIEQTVQKIQYVSGNIKLQKSLKPKTASNSISRSKLLSPKDSKMTDTDWFYGSDNKQFSEKETHKRNHFELNIPTNKKAKGHRYLLDVPEPDIYSNKGRRSSQATKTEEGFDMKFINKAKLGQVLQRVSKSHRDKKSVEITKVNLKGLVEGLGADLNEFDRRKPEELQHQAKSSRFFVRVQSKESYRAPLNTEGNNKNKVSSPNKIFSPQGLKELGDDNIFNFTKYFKKKYMEKETPFEVSDDLKKRIHSFEKGIKLSARKSQNFSLKDKPS